MRIALFGATGGAGQAILARSLHLGHEVTVLARTPTALEQRRGLTIIGGNVLDSRDVSSAVRGQDAIIAALGHPAGGGEPKTVTVCTDGTRNILHAMVTVGVSTIVSISTHGANESNDGSEYSSWLRSVSLGRIEDKERMEDLLSASDRTWTVVRAPRISELPGRGATHVAEGLLVTRDTFVSRDNLAAFVVSEAEHPAHAGMRLSIEESPNAT